MWAFGTTGLSLASNTEYAIKALAWALKLARSSELLDPVHTMARNLKNYYKHCNCSSYSSNYVDFSGYCSYCSPHYSCYCHPSAARSSSCSVTRHLELLGLE